MNFVRSKSRNSMDPKRMNDLVYVRHNLLQLEKVRSLAHGGAAVTKWTDEELDLDSDEDAWEDAWQPAKEAEALEYEASREERASRSKLRGKAFKAVAARRIRPKSVANATDSANAAEATASRSGRQIRRPAVLDL
jgi:hypothetical protein